MIFKKGCLVSVVIGQWKAAHAPARRGVRIRVPVFFRPETRHDEVGG